MTSAEIIELLNEIDDFYGATRFTGRLNVAIESLSMQERIAQLEEENENLKNCANCINYQIGRCDTPLIDDDKVCNKWQFDGKTKQERMK